MVESTKQEKSKVDDDYPLERMLDPCTDRVMKEVPLPPRYPLTYKQLFTATNSTCNYRNSRLMLMTLVMSTNSEEFTFERFEVFF